MIGILADHGPWNNYLRELALRVIAPLQGPASLAGKSSWEFLGNLRFYLIGLPVDEIGMMVGEISE